MVVGFACIFSASHRISAHPYNRPAKSATACHTCPNSPGMGVTLQLTDCAKLTVQRVPSHTAAALLYRVICTLPLLLHGYSVTQH